MATTATVSSGAGGGGAAAAGGPQARAAGGLSPEDYIRFSCQLYLDAPSYVSLSDDEASKEALGKLLENQVAKIYATLSGGSTIVLSEDAPGAVVPSTSASSASAAATTTTTAAADATTTADDSAAAPNALLIGHAGTGRVEAATQLLMVPLKDWSTVLRQQAVSWMHVVESTAEAGAAAAASSMSSSTITTSTAGAVIEQLRGLEYTLLTQSTNLVLQVHPEIAAAAQRGRKVEELADDPQFSDDGFLNTIQAGVSEWIQQIKNLIQRTKTVPPLESVGDELRYWVQLNASLQDARDQLESDPGVVLTLSLLRLFKRFVATRTLETLGLESALAYTGDVVHFLKPLPIDKLANAKDFSPQLASALHDAWTQMHKVRQSRYPLDRVVQLGVAVTRLARDTLLTLLNKAWMFWEYADYERDVYFPCHDVLVRLNEQWDDFRAFVSEQAKRRKVSVKTDVEHAAVALERRLQVLHEFRSNHERLVQVLKVVQIDHIDATPRQVFGALDVLDLSPKGQMHLDQALEDYSYQMEALEERLAKLLRDKLAACGDAEDMFAVFARFHLLLTRPRVRAAVKEFQVQLITTVASAIQKLQSKFVCKYEDTAAARLSRLRGIPPVSGKILWALQMERQVHSLMTKMENVLGKNWGQELEGRQLKKAGDELLAKLDAKAFFRKWVLEWEKQVTAIATSRLHSYPVVVESNGPTLYVKVNFDDMHAVLANEIRHLKFLGFKADIPRTLTTMADEAVMRYPYAVAIQTALSCYQTTRSHLSGDLEMLVTPELLAVRDCISQAFGIKLFSSAAKKQRRVRWQDAAELSTWVSLLVDVTQKLEDRVEGLLSCRQRIHASVAALEDVAYEASAFQGILVEIQKVIDEMSLSGYANLDLWVQQLASTRIGRVLTKRLQQALRDWVGTFSVRGSDDDDEGDATVTSVDTDADATEHLASHQIKCPPIQVDIVLRNQEISSMPAMPAARSVFFNMLHEYMGVVCGLPRPKSGRYEVFDSATPRNSSLAASASSTTFGEIIHALPVKLVAEAYSVMDDHVNASSSFVDQWLAYQVLWDSQVSDILSSVGTDIDRWQALLIHTSNSRSTLDTASSTAEFGPFVIKFGKVQSQINLKYDSWQKDLQSAFASILGQAIAETHAAVSAAKARLEATTLDAASTENIVLGVTFIQEVKQRVSAFKKDINSLEASEKLLKKQRYAFHSDWMETSVVIGLFESLLQVLDRRSRTMEQQIPVLQARVAAEDTTSKKSLSDLLKQWEQEKPLRGNRTPSEALTVLLKFEISLNNARIHRENLIRAKDALGLEHSIDYMEVADRISELSDLKEVWEAIKAPYTELEGIKDTPWTTAVMRKVKRSLDDLLAAMRSLPNRIRQYDAYVQLHDTVKGYVAGHSLLSDLKTEALKERHWKSILQRLGIQIPFTDLTVGVLWDSGVLSRKKDMVEILTVAQGELALEVFLGQVRDRWTKQELDMVLFQNRTRLIRGWDDLFSTLDDHISGLALMKSSPYYRSVREFQEDGKAWEDRLTMLRTAFDSWVDVQRRWVYLEGIFFGSSDIKAQLPSEWSRFKSVDSEFVALMRRIAAKPYAMEVLNVDNLQRTLERLANVMSVIQRALGDYLAKQRIDFSRFYFLGDDDLLEIMGSGEPGQVLAHIGKMFAGIAGARRTSEGLPDGVKTRLEAMVSKDGEVVSLHHPIDIAADTNVKDWLKEFESVMQETLAVLLQQAVESDSFSEGVVFDEANKTNFVDWTNKFPAQVMILAAQISWSMGVDKALGENEAAKSLKSLLTILEWKLEVMATMILKDLPAESRKKLEQLITELVRQRDVVRTLIDSKVSDATDFRWLYHLRYNYNPDAATLTDKLTVMLSNAKFKYGFEYLGIGERLVQTPLTDKCYLTLTQALHFRLGGSPFGPAGTGKTESVKALGAALGRFVLVFNCDETFDYSAMGRLLAGLSQVGAWGCFDEFNRLEERILSAVSQQILTIQRGLLDRRSTIELLGRPITLHENVGIFVTMNPGYEGRSNLPDNLKTLFRSFAMVVPDRNLIAQVMLYSQGIVTAELLAGRIVELFLLCESRMSKQRHYDFGLRALKTLLVSAGALKRQSLEGLGDLSGDELAAAEKNALIRGACNNVLPKLVAEDLPVFSQILEETFPGSAVASMADDEARGAIVSTCAETHLLATEPFIQKVLQLKQVLEMRHGVMVVGRAGKSSALRVLLKVLEAIDGRKGELYMIDPKAVSKDRLYGTLDGTTLEWTDGVFTCILRRIIENQKGEAERRHWIVFDGDVDPEWAENLNSVLDDNMMLTLPSGERLSLPSNVRIILEVDNLEHTTPATVSRCGMVWFSDDIVTPEMCLESMLESLGADDLLGDGNVSTDLPAAQSLFLEQIRPLFVSGRTSSLVVDALDFALRNPHVMDPSRDRLLNTLKAMLAQGIIQAIEYDENHPDYPMTGEHMEKFAQRWLLHSLMWSFCGSSPGETRMNFSKMLLQTSGVALPEGGRGYTLLDYKVRVESGEYELWSDSVPRMEIESHRVAATDVVITTTDTVRHSDVITAFLGRRLPLILCGPPGSGKTMTLTSVLQSVQGVVLASLNFSSRTTPEMILKTFSQYCSYVRRGKNVYCEPAENLGAESWLVIFCDEINLPEEDAYGTQRVIMFMRQLVEHGGFWRSDNVWIKTNRIQFVGACNPPSDAGRVEMSHRFLRHVPLLFVDFPTKDSLLQIYRTFNGGLMKLFPHLKGETEAMTEAMVELYVENQSRFTTKQQPQYFYSPRELSRYVRGIYEAVKSVDALTREDLVRIWAHEGLRLFCDRLVREQDKQWCNDQVDAIARKWFAGVDFAVALSRPLFYTSWLSKESRRVDREELRDFLGARLRVFYEEELDIPLVVFDEVLDHILRIDRVLRQPMGHVLLVGDSGAGKTVLSKFVAWMNGLSIFQIKAHSRYNMDNFNDDLRSIMRRVGVDGERLCFIFDESNVLSSGFIEAINALLASGEVPGLFDGDDYSALVVATRDSALRDGIDLRSEEEVWRHFTSVVQRNLHVVFTINPSGGDWKNRSTTSPALFNRCVVDWFGTWSNQAMAEVAREFTSRLDMGEAETAGGSWGIGAGEDLMKGVQGAFEGRLVGSIRHAVVAALVNIHGIAKEIADASAAETTSVTRTFLSPRDYLALIHNFVSCLNERREKVEDEQLHVNAGLEKLKQTQQSVIDLKSGLGAKTAELKKKEALANEKLRQMVTDQNEAEKRKDDAEKVSAQVRKQEAEIIRRKDQAQRDLDEAEPALRSAQQSVRGIKKRDLDEVRNLARPPTNVKLTLECVAMMMGESSVEWSDVRKLIAKTDFIPNIINFDADKLSSKQIKLINDKYLDGNPDLTEESVNRSSKACGPLYLWASSQIKYSTIYNNIQPLREEVAQLEEQAKIAKANKEAIESEVSRLESSISQYKSDYATLIRDVEALKSEMKAVTTKIYRAESLLTSLSHESDRWAKSSELFQSVMESLIGDALLMAAFLTYAGFFDFKTRATMKEKWQKTLELLDIDFRSELGMVESLSTASQRLDWQSLGLAGDRLSLENAVILEHGIRFPLVIDPSGHAISFLLNKYKGDKIQTTSFLDKAFSKTLTGAVRFGTTLLVEGVEKLDPLIHPVLNKELQRTGGRTLVRIGTEDVDYSPKFRLILTTKNPAVRLTPDVCSRVTLVNFTVTPDSLQSQCLSLLVRSIRPELEEQRAALMRRQGEQNVKLRELEDRMLSTISACEGSILDDDKVVSGMEVLMKEGSQVELQIEKSEEVMRQVHEAVARFEPFAVICRRLFILLVSLRELSFLYEFPAQSFMRTLEHCLEEKAGSPDTEEAHRIDLLRSELFREVAGRIGRGLQLEDKIVLSILLARLSSNDPELGSHPASNTASLIQLIVEAFGSDFPWQGRALNDLYEVTELEINAAVPMLLCSAPGHDVSGRVEAMARDRSKELAAVAMGSAEGYDAAEMLVSTAAKRGTWVMLKNVHLCVDWLRETLVKRLQGLGPETHHEFRIFITCEINPRIPTALLRICDKLVADAPTGLKASLIRFFSSISKDRFTISIRNRLYLLLGWTHAVIQERLRFVPHGWSESYEWTEADASHALDVIDSLFGEAGRQQLDPEKLPWDAIRSTLCKGVFGGRITEDRDQAVLDDLVNRLFTPRSFDVGFSLVPNVADSPVLPEGASRDECVGWIARLPLQAPPTWIGLDASAEVDRERRLAGEIVGKVSALQIACDADSIP